MHCGFLGLAGAGLFCFWDPLGVSSVATAWLVVAFAFSQTLAKQ